LEASASIQDSDGFIKTGDLGYFNENGVLFVVDRKKDIMKYKGYHVNPSEIENIIESIDGVQQVSVVGIPDEMATNLFTAAIVKRKGFESLNEHQIISHVASVFPEYKQLHGGVYFFDKLPMTANGKVIKRFIIDEILLMKK
jgi:acyl-CoA synthetase (AMP-forming)/AMP-acid ligase II